MVAGRTLDTRQLQRLVVDRRHVVDHRTGLGNRLQALLKDYFPQALAICIGEEVFRPLATAFLKRWPTLQRGPKGHPHRAPQILLRPGLPPGTLAPETARAHPFGRPPDRLSGARRTAMCCAPASPSTNSSTPPAPLRPTTGRSSSPLKIIPSTLSSPTSPVPGPAFAPRLLASFGTQRERYATAANFQCASGIAPVTETERQEAPGPPPLPLLGVLQAKPPRMGRRESSSSAVGHGPTTR